MSFEQGQTVRYEHGWYGDIEATILAVLPEWSKYRYAIQFKDDEDNSGLEVDFANDDDLKLPPASLTLDVAALRELRNVLRVAKGDHRDKYGQDCACLQRIDSLLEIVEKALNGEA